MKQHGFTLVELMIVVGILGALTSIFALNAQSSVREARAVACEKNRTLAEDLEQKFNHEMGRPSLAIQELIDRGYINRHPCPRGGVMTWKVEDESLPYARQALVCSIHGEKQRIRKWIPPLANAGPDYAMSDSFDGPTAAGWTSTKGKYWQLVDGKYRAGTLTKKTPGQHRSFSGSESWTDYDVSTKVTLLRGQGYGIFFRASDPSKVDGYAFQYDPGVGGGTFAIRKFTNGAQGKAVASVKAPKGYDWYGSEKNVKIEVRGDTFTAYVDGSKVVSGSDSTYASGAIGLRTRNRAVADFDDVQVVEK